MPPELDGPEPEARGERIDTLRAVTVGALLVIAAGLVLDAPADLTSDQRVLIAALAGVLAVLIGLSASVYRGRR